MVGWVVRGGEGGTALASVADGGVVGILCGGEKVVVTESKGKAQGLIWTDVDVTRI